MNEANSLKPAETQALNIPVVRCSLYESFFPNFKSNIKPTRTESADSDLIYDRNGRRKSKFFGF